MKFWKCYNEIWIVSINYKFKFENMFILEFFMKLMLIIFVDELFVVEKVLEFCDGYDCLFFYEEEFNVIDFKLCCYFMFYKWVFMSVISKLNYKF